MKVLKLLVVENNRLLLILEQTQRVLLQKLKQKQKRLSKKILLERRLKNTYMKDTIEKLIRKKRKAEVQAEQDTQRQNYNRNIGGGIYRGWICS